MNSGKRRIVGEFIVLTIYLIIDAYGMWGVSHFWALLFAALGICALVFAEFSHESFMVISFGIIVVCTVFYFLAPPILPEETENHGWLIPADETTPSNGCGTSLPPDSLLMVFGTDGIVGIGSGRFTPVKVGSCPILTLERAPEGLKISADAFNGDGSLIYRIEDNEFHLIPGQYSYAKRPDRHSLIVYDREGREKFFVKYVNGRSVRVRGTFLCKDSAPITIGDNKILPFNVTLSNSCAKVRAGTPAVGFEFQAR